MPIINDYILPDGGKYSGEANDFNQPNGKGLCEWNNGLKYDGSWIEGKMHGTGILTSTNKIVKGFWFEGELIHTFSEERLQTNKEGRNEIKEHHGKRILTNEDGSRYEGYLVNGKMHGVGTLYKTNGEIVRGFWFEGELIHIFSTEPETTHTHKNLNTITALLIGNDYPGEECNLPNCVSDVRSIGQKLRRIGADVKILENASKDEIINEIETFASKGNQYDNALFYFSGHGEVRGPFHVWIANDGEWIIKELHLLFPLVETNYKNLILISDACNINRAIANEDLEDDTIQKILKVQNALHNRNITSAYSSLDGQVACAIGNDVNGIYAIALMEYIEHENLPITDMFNRVNQFVKEYAMRKYGGLIEIPHTDYTTFDPDFCLYRTK